MKLDAHEWERLWGSIGASGEGARWFGILSAKYEEPHRHYHNAEHIVECLREFRGAEDLIEARDAVEMAIWLHDVIYDPKRPDNEEESGRFAIELCRDGKLSGSSAEKIGELILATKHNAIPRDPDARFIVDIDLTILGKAPERFWRYEEDVRKEYSFVPEEIFRAKRAEILEAFLGREKIYQTDFFADRYEKTARGNLVESVRRLRGF